MNEIPKAIIEAAENGVDAVSIARFLEIPSDERIEIAEAALKSAHVGELLEVLENLLNHLTEFFPDFPIGGKETELTSKAKAVIARAKGEA